ncbi:MAG: SpoIIE family protein phosphatase [Planctomycetota bacterium]
MTTALRLIRTAGPDDVVVGDGFELAADRSVIGRSPSSTHCLPYESVSRVHASVRHRDGRWTITDEGSTSGTFINGLRIEPYLPAVLSVGDELAIGPWTFRAAGDGSRAEQTIELTTTRHELHVRTPSRRLSALSSCIDRLSKSERAEDLAASVVRSGLEGTGLVRGAVLKPTAQSGVVSLVAAAELSHGQITAVRGERFDIPGSLIERAMLGETAVLDGSPVEQHESTDSQLGQSIVEMRVHSAVCVPVKLDGRIAAMLYFDARGSEAPVVDAAAFCEDLGQIYALCLVQTARAELLKRQADMRAELDRAKLVRDMVSPPSDTVAGRYRIAFRSEAGMLVSGDLFDVIERDAGDPVVLFGDATGHGVGAAMLTALVHARLHALIGSGMPHAQALTQTNAYVANHAMDGSFVSLWSAALRQDGRLDIVDAGHGHWFVLRAVGTVEPVERAASVPLGIAADAEFQVIPVHLHPRDRVILYTDGISEQRTATGQQLGNEWLHEVVLASTSSQTDVQHIIEHALDAAGRGGIDDDATVASIEFLAD